MLLETEKTLTPLSIDTKLLFDADSKHEYEDAIFNAVQYIKGFLNNENFYSGEKPNNLRALKHLIQADPSSPISIEESLKEIKTLFLDHAISFHNPQYVAHLNCPILIPALVGDLIASSVNTAVETWDQSTSATLIEQEMIRWISNEFKFPKEADGVFTSGGTQSNFMALLMARDHYAFKHFGLNLKENGWADVVSKFRFFCSDKAHFSIKKNAALLGMGYNSVITIETDERMKMKPEALVQAIEKEKQHGNIPIGIVATMGTTDFGSFDPLTTISKIAKEYDIWLHADGAYGGCYVITDTHKHLLESVQYADSVTVDFHKTMFQPVCSSAFIAKNRQHFRYVSYYADYLNPLESRDTECPNLIEKSLQTTRRFDALKLWFTLKVTGQKTLASYLEAVHLLAQEIYHEIKNDPFFEVIHEPELSTLVFRFKAKGIEDNTIHDTINLFIKNTLFKSGQTSVASTKYNGNTYLKFTLLNPKSTISNLIDIINQIKQKGQEYKMSN
ncbi:pyridoxal phosphate-dependent decarboxylase family protein [Aquimarina hainanensis]|uniref:Pyridoxal phosphate-dependent decarboxylase family protein n=1 Tax=Aquimarina hainanensis TaxID=1578017 RepID=A0ABW5NC15_9FLAO|nr:aspartate aminotransferase family protein [Aquimarina sp. TRL1]QKX03683.1 aspartate aminotransferase family protein [Aquimarina sp. TRL1]